MKIGLRPHGRSALLLAVLCLVALVPSRSAHAQGNYRSTPIGGRTALMGGTGVVYGRDGAAPFTNPATILAVAEHQLAFAVNFYTFTVFRARSWYAPGPIDSNKLGAVSTDDATLTDLEFNALPSSLCFFITSSAESRLSLCLATTRASTFSFAAEDYSARGSDGRSSRQAQTILESYSHFALGPSYSLRLSERLSVGASLHGSLVAHRGVHNAVANLYGVGTPISSAFYSGTRGDSAQLTAIAGLTYRFDRFTAGAAVEAPSLHVYGVGAANRYTHFEGAGSSTRSTSLDGGFVSASPFRASVGAGVVAERWIAEINAHFYAPMAAAYRANLRGSAVVVDAGIAREEAVDIRLSQRANAVFDMNLGGQYFVSRALSVLGGISTDFSAVPRDGLGRELFNYYPTRSQRLALSLGVGSHGEAEELLVGTEVSYAWGDRLAVNSYQLPPVFQQAPHRTFVALFIVAGSTSLKAIKRAVLDAADVMKRPN